MGLLPYVDGPDASSGQVIVVAGKFKKVRDFLRGVAWNEVAPNARKTDAFHPRRGPGFETFVIIFLVIETARKASRVLTALGTQNQKTGNPVRIKRLTAEESEMTEIYDRMKGTLGSARAAVRTIVDPNEKPSSEQAALVHVADSIAKENLVLFRELQELDCQIAALKATKMALTVSHDMLRTFRGRSTESWRSGSP